jgi:hypothetical protein
VEVSFATEHMANTHKTLLSLLDNLPPTLSELRLLKLSDTGLHALDEIAKKFCQLKVLELSCAERLDSDCCWLCFEESTSLVNHSPVPDMSSCAEELTVRCYLIDIQSLIFRKCTKIYV